MDLERMQALLSDFQQKARETGETLAALQARLESGRALAPAGIEALDRQLSDLWEDYALLRDEAGRAAGGDPEEDAPAEEWVRRWEESLALRERTAALRADMEALLRVTSDDPKCEEALEPLRAQARQVLAAPQVAEEAGAAPRLFLQALAEEDDTRLDALLEQLESALPDMPLALQRGLLRKKYVLPAGEAAPAPCPPADVPASAPVEEAPAAPAPVLADEPPAAPAEEPEQGKEEKPEEEPEELLRPLARLKNTPPGASSFRKELPRLPQLTTFVLPLLSHLGILTAEQIFDLTGIMDCEPVPADRAELEGILALLQRKDFLAAYPAGRGGEAAYCLTAYCVGSMEKEQIRKLESEIFQLDTGTYPVTACLELPGGRVRALLAQNDLLIGLLDRVSRHDPERYEEVQQSIRLEGERYTVTLFTAEGERALRLCRPEELPGLTGDLLLPEKEDPAAGPGQTLWCFTDRPWVRTGAGWEDMSIPAEKEEPAPEEEPAPAEKPVSAEMMAAPAGEPAAPEEGPAPAQPAAPAPVPREPAPEGEPLPGPEPVPEKLPAPAPVPEEPPEPGPEEVSAPTPEETLRPDHSPEAMARALLDRCTGPVSPTDEELRELIFALLESGLRIREGDLVRDQLIQAVVLARCAAVSRSYPGCGQLYDQLLAATDLPLGRGDYAGEKLFALFPGDDPGVEELMLSAYLRAMFAPSQPHDYTLQGRVDNLFQQYEQYFPSFPEAKALFHTLLSIRDSSPGGFTNAVLSYLGGEDKREDHLRRLSQRAEALRTFNRNAVPHINGMVEMIDLCFGAKGDLQTCLEFVIQGRTEARPLVEDAIRKFWAPDRPGEVDDHILEEYIDDTWNRARQQYDPRLNRGRNRMDLASTARKQIRAALLQRLELLREWLDMTEESVEKNSRSLRGIREELQQTIPAVIAALGDRGVVIRSMLEHLLRRLSDEPEDPCLFADLLRTGHLSLDEAGLPVVDRTLDQVRYYEPWRNMLAHIAAPVRGLREVREEIYDPDSPLFDNLAQARHIDRFLGEEPGPFQVKEAQETAQGDYDHFREELELSYTYNRLTEKENETLESLMRDYKDGFFALQDFGSWRSFLKALGRQMDEFSEQNSRRLGDDLASRRSALPEGAACPLLDKAGELLEERNLALTEEYLNRFDAGERDLPEAFRAAGGTSNYFLSFLSPQVFDPIYKQCQNYGGKSLRSFGNDYLTAHRPAGWGNRQLDSAKRFLATWPAGKGAFSPKTVGDFFRELGIEVEKEAAVQSKGQADCFELTVRHDRFNKADYRHPIAAFGTKLAPSLRVSCFFGTFTAQQLVDSVCAMELSGMSVVLVDSAIDRAARCKIAEIVHTEKNTGQKPFLIIDRVLMLYLATLQETERLPAMLQCTLPYTIYQPFTRGSGATSDEMFCGRVRELSSITDDNGACIVYGGRQLGKTALLQRAASLGNVPEERRYALFITISDCRDEASFAVRVSTDIRALGLPLPEAGTIEQLGAGLRALFRDKWVVKLHLLLDEADDFLESIAAQEYRPLQPLVDLRRETGNNFKFVLAGLHNVFRAKAASTPNSILGQLGDPLCIEPLSAMDAFRLLSRPLEYLGFRIESDTNMSTILTNTNNYPGIIQFFGFKLVESLSTQYAQYYNAANRNPPFPLSDKQLRSIITSNELNDGIRRRLRLTLDLDPRYLMLARCIAMLYLLNEGDMGGRGYGFSVDEIRDVARTWPIHCLEGAGVREYAALLDELVEMGILSRFEDRQTYRLRRYTFLGVIAPNLDMDALEREILADNGEEGEEA